MEINSEALEDPAPFIRGLERVIDPRYGTVSISPYPPILAM